MESHMLKTLKSHNPEKDYPSNMGQKWNVEEEKLLLDELDKNIDINIIAEIHNRTVGGIVGKQRDIAYKMYLTNANVEEIILKTKLNKELITETITKKDLSKTRVKVETKPATKLDLFKPKRVSLENEVIEMRIEIKELKHTIKELVEMMKAVYEFEDT